MSESREYAFATNLPKGKADKIVNALRKVYDPEIQISVYDLGLIYEVVDKDKVLYVKMTMTSAGCPLAEILARHVGSVIHEVLPEYEDVEIDVVFDPPWTPARMTKEGREKFKQLFGYDVVESWTRQVIEG